MSYDLFSYPHKAAFKDNTTSREAAEAIEGSGRAQTLRDRVQALLYTGHSATADEIAAALKEQPFAIRPRVTELYKQGVIERTGARRLAAGGRPSHVYRLKVSA